MQYESYFWKNSSVASSPFVTNYHVTLSSQQFVCVDYLIRLTIYICRIPRIWSTVYFRFHWAQSTNWFEPLIRCPMSLKWVIIYESFWRLYQHRLSPLNWKYWTCATTVCFLVVIILQKLYKIHHSNTAIPSK